MKLKEKDKRMSAKIIADALSAQVTEFTIGKPGEKPVSYVIVKEGILEVRRTKAGVFSKMKNEMNVENVKDVIETMSKVPGISNEVIKVKESLSNLPSAKTIPSFQLLTPKIPITLFHQIVRFFRVVYANQETEAAALIRWSQDRQEYYIEIPGGPDGKEQDLSAGSVKYKPDPANRDIIVMDIHSHHVMGDFFSSIDDNDEQFTQLYGVVGNIDHSQPTASFRARMHGEDIATPPIEEIFDIPNFPGSWMEKIKEPEKITKTSWSGDENMYSDGYQRWYERRHGESVAEYTERMREAKSSRRSLQTETVPRQRNGESDEDYFQRLNGKKELPPSTGDMLNGDDVLESQREIWDVIENEILDRAEVYQHRATIVALRDYITDKLNDLSPKEIKAWANS